MSREPILPYVYGSTGFRLSVRHPSKIIDALKVAGADIVTISEQEIEDRLNEEVSRFLDARQYSVKQTSFRPVVKALKKSLDLFVDSLPDDYSPLAAELEKHWRYSMMHKTPPRFTDPTPIVGEQTPIAHLRAELHRFSRGLEALAAEVGVGKAGRTEAREEHELVEALAAHYSGWTQKPPSQGIKEVADNPNDRATGRFADFIRSILSETREQMVDRLCRQGLLTGRDKVEPLTRGEAEDLVGPIDLPSLSSLIQALSRRQSAQKQR